MNLTLENMKTWLQKTNTKLIVQKDYLTALDQKIGDGDHGINMARGFQAIVNQINRDERQFSELQSIAELMQVSAHTLMTTVGGASGILYATAFLNMATVFQNNTVVNHETFTEALKSAVEGLEKRGNVRYGEKTLLDVWVPMLQLFEQSSGFPEASIIEKRAKEAMQQTERSIAKKGKASFYEEKSLGHVDPGATSTYYMFTALAEVCKENQNG